LPTDTPTLAIPTPEPPTSTPTPGPAYLVNSLRAFVRGQTTTAYLDGPSTIYTRTVALNPNTEVRLFGRTASGEWVYGCCQNGNQPFWVRQAYAPPANNDPIPGAPTETNPNDVRWLPVQPVSSGVQPLPSSTPIPEGDYPLYRYSRSAAGQLPRLPRPPLVEPWTAPAQASQSLSSPAIVSRGSVLVGSRDNHLYSFDRENGNQRWRYQMGRAIIHSPAVLDGEVFVVDDGDPSQLFALRDQGNSAALIWGPVNTGARAVTSFNVFSDTLLIGVGTAPSFQLLTVDRDNGNILRRYTDISGSALLYPAIGDQLVYVAAGQLKALDVLNNEQVWVHPNIANLTAGPVYSSPGVRGLAELYVADGSNRIFALNANTGVEYWNYGNGDRVSGLAVSSSALLVSGNGYIRAISRDTGQLLWNASTAGETLGGPWTDNSLVVAFTTSGTLVFLDAATGSVLLTPGTGAAAAGAGAVSNPWVFMPGQNNALHGMRGNP
jgi:outer membrane protein assembly factor BamB